MRLILQSCSCPIIFFFLLKKLLVCISCSFLDNFSPISVGACNCTSVPSLSCHNNKFGDTRGLWIRPRLAGCLSLMSARARRAIPHRPDVGGHKQVEESPPTPHPQRSGRSFVDRHSFKKKNPKCAGLIRHLSPPSDILRPGASASPR